MAIERDTADSSEACEPLRLSYIVAMYCDELVDISGTNALYCSGRDDLKNILFIQCSLLLVFGGRKLEIGNATWGRFGGNKEVPGFLLSVKGISWLHAIVI